MTTIMVVVVLLVTLAPAVELSVTGCSSNYSRFVLQAELAELVNDSSDGLLLLQRNTLSVQSSGSPVLSIDDLMVVVGFHQPCRAFLSFVWAFSTN